METISDRELIAYGYTRENCNYQVPNEIALIILEFIKTFIDSDILSPEESEYLVQLIEEQAQTAKFKHCEWKLLCRGSRDGLDYNKFHEYCDGKKNTVCIADIQPNGFVSGGYASTEWKSTDRNVPAKDDDAYLFCVRPSDKRKVYHRSRDKDGNLKSEFGILYNKSDAFNFGYNSFFWCDGYKIPVDTFEITEGDTYYQVEDFTDLIGEYEYEETQFTNFEVFQLIKLK